MIWFQLWEIPIVKKIFLIPQHIDANNDPDIIDLEEETTKEGEQEPIPRIGHWILTVYVRMTNQIFVLNSLPSYVPKTYLLKEAFPTAQMVFFSKLPRQVGGVECGYWCWFFCFLFYIGTVTLENIENYIGHLAKEYFQRIKEIIKSIPLKAERHIPDDYKEFIHQKIRESHQRERRQKNGNKWDYQILFFDLQIMIEQIIFNWFILLFFLFKNKYFDNVINGFEIRTLFSDLTLVILFEY